MSLLALLSAAAGDSTPVDPDPELIPVTAQAPTADDTADTLTIPTQAGVVYLIDGSTVDGMILVGDVNATVTVTAQATDGYVLQGTSSWSFTFTGTAVLTPLHPGVTAATPPPASARWTLDSGTAPYLTTDADLPLQVDHTAVDPTAPALVDSALGPALYMNGLQSLVIPPESLGRLQMGGNGTQVTVSAWVYLAKHGQVALAGIWGEFADPPRRQYALFYDLPAYGGDDMSCFHVSKDGNPTPGYPYSTDYSANPVKLNLAEWHLFTGTYDGTQAVSYLDGIAYAHHTGATRAGDGKRNPYTFTDGLNSTPWEFAVSKGAPLAGMIRDVRVWDTALTPAQVLGLYDQTPPPATDLAVDVTFEGAVELTNTGGTTWGATIPLGTPRAGRLVAVSLAWARNLTRTITAATIDGTPVAFTNPTGSGTVNIGFVHAVIPEGTTGELSVTLSNDATGMIAQVATLDGAATTPSVSAGNAGTNTFGFPASAEGGAILSVVRPGVNNSTSMLPGETVHNGPAPNAVEPHTSTTMAASLTVSPATGYFFPMWATRGSFGSSPAAVAAIAFDPA